MIWMGNCAAAKVGIFESLYSDDIVGTVCYPLSLRRHDELCAAHDCLPILNGLRVLKMQCMYVYVIKGTKLIAFEE